MFSHKTIKFILSSIIIFIILCILIICTLVNQIKIPNFEKVHSTYRPSDAWIVDRNGIPMESIRIGHETRNLAWIAWKEASPSFQDLLVQVEDKRFYSHHGVDFLAIARTAINRLFHHTNGGASTITMQLATLLNQKQKANHHSFIQKITQALTALKLDFTWSKEEILEAYINLTPFRGELVGLRAASLGYFGKNPSGLLQEESAFLVALLRSPNATQARVAKRVCQILEKDTAATGQQDQEIKQNEETFCSELTAKYLAESSHLSRLRQIIPILSKRFISEGWNTSVIHTSLDAHIQQLALNSMREQLNLLKNQNVHDAAVLILDTKTGRVIAYAANAGAGVASAEQTDGIQTRRQAGSTIKPFVYATAFDRRILLPESLLEDSPADIPIDDGRIYHPQNYDHLFRGLVSASEALGSSMNVPAVRAITLVGEEQVLNKLKSLGFEKLQDAEFYGPSLALGTMDVTLWELTQGYRQLANANHIFSPETNAQIFNILSSQEYRRFTFGMDSLLTLPFQAAVKTGTSKDMRDNWCIGWTANYTVGVWVGNFNGEPMWDVSGIAGAAPIWRNLMLALHPNPVQAIITEYLAPATPLKEKILTKIRYPAANMLIGLDPEIPESVQKLPIEIENPRPGDQLFLNEKLLGRAQETLLWPLKIGKYEIELKNSAKQNIETVKFEVR